MAWSRSVEELIKPLNGIQAALKNPARTATIRARHAERPTLLPGIVEYIRTIMKMSGHLKDEPHIGADSTASPEACQKFYSQWKEHHTALREQRKRQGEQNKLDAEAVEDVPRPKEQLTIKMKPPFACTYPAFEQALLTCLKSAGRGAGSRASVFTGTINVFRHRQGQRAHFKTQWCGVCARFCVTPNS
jgi:hypothetical protein